MISDIAIRFGNAIRVIRCREGISQEELADRCELHRTYVSDVELGKRNISLKNIERLSDALNVSLVELFEEVGKNESIY